MNESNRLMETLATGRMWSFQDLFLINLNNIQKQISHLKCLQKGLETM